jgi:hypothetical protein
VARSKYIYLIQSRSTGDVLATCTVKRELVELLRKYGFSKEEILVLRYIDGHYQPNQITDLTNES